MKSDDVADFANILIARNVRRRDRQRLFLLHHPNPSLWLYPISVTYNHFARAAGKVLFGA
jgi:hypothetical protein